MRKTSFNKGMAFLTSAFAIRNMELKPETIEVYWQILKDYHDKDWEVSVKQAVRTLNWFPSLGQLISLLSPRHEIRTAAEEWDELIKAAEDGQNCPDVSPQAIRALAVVGGYEQFRRTNYEGLRFAYKQFESAYKTQIESHVERQRLGYGEVEQIGNTVKGLLEFEGD